MKKKITALALALCLALCLAPAAAAEGNKYHSGADYLADTLTLAGTETSAEGGETITRAAAAAALERVLNGG